MKPILFTVYFTFFFVTITLAQQGTGLNLNKETFKKNVTSFPDPEQGMKSFSEPPLKFDLTQFAPPVCNQGTAESCVAWSTAYNAYTIQYAAQNNITDSNQLQKIALSAMLPYKKLRPNCAEGLNLPDIAQEIINSGNVMYPDFDATTCQISPNRELLERARQNRPIMTYTSIFDWESTSQQKISQTKKQIGMFKTPVIVGIQITANLHQLSSVDEFYSPEGPVTGYHAVVVVGYDMRGFKILNSWGPDWGQKGYFYVTSNTFATIAEVGMVLTLSDNFKPGPVKKVSKLGGEFAFQYLNNDSGEFTRVIPRHQGNGVYELDKKDWKVGEMFQLLTNNPTARQYMAVFSIDAQNEVRLHWPRNEQFAAYNENLFGLTESEILPNLNFDVIIPDRYHALSIDNIGVDNLCVIYSDKPIASDLNRILKLLKGGSGDIYTRLKAAMGNRLVRPADITYTASGMRGTAETSQGDTVPIILKIRSSN